MNHVDTPRLRSSAGIEELPTLLRRSPTPVDTDSQMQQWHVSYRTSDDDSTASMLVSATSETEALERAGAELGSREFNLKALHVRLKNDSLFLDRS